MHYRLFCLFMLSIRSKHLDADQVLAQSRCGGVRSSQLCMLRLFSNLAALSKHKLCPFHA